MRTRVFAVLFALTILASPALAVHQHSEHSNDSGYLTAGQLEASRVRTAPDAVLATEQSRFLDRYDLRHTEVQWDQYRQTPIRIRGEGIATGAKVDSAARAEQVSRDFVRANESFLNAREADLQLVDSRYFGTRWIVIFQQYYQGLEVIDGRVDTRLRSSGVVSLVSSKFFPGIELATKPAIAEQDALKYAAKHLEEETFDFTLVHQALVVSPQLVDDRYEYHLAWMVIAKHNQSSRVWNCIIDANTGAFLRRRAITMEVTGTVRGGVNFNGALNPAISTPLENLTLDFGNAVTALSDSSGAFDSSNTPLGTVTARLRGPWVVTSHETGASAAVTQTIGGPTVSISFDNTNSTTSERDTFYFTNLTHRWVKTIDPAFTAMDYAPSAKVLQNPPDASLACNAWWDESERSMNFVVKGSGCSAPTGQFGDVIAHEYGHGLTYATYGSLKWNSPTRDMHEGCSDVIASTQMDDPRIGRDYFGANTQIRTCLNTQTWPGNNCGGDDYCRSQALSGGMWDMRTDAIAAFGKAPGVAWSDLMFHSARLARPDEQPDFVAELYDSDDDDDGNLANGTPNFDLICDNWGPRGFDCPQVIQGVAIVHDPLSTTDEDQADYPVTATITTTNTLIVDAKLNFSLNGAPFRSLAMSRVSGSLFRAFIPAQPLGTRIRYSISASDNGGETAEDPETVPAIYHEFMILERIFFNDFEAATDEGWTHSQIRTQDDWHHDIQAGSSSYDPGSAYSGTRLWGNDLGGFRAGNNWDGNYQNNATNQLLSPGIDCSGYRSVRLVYRRWLTTETSDTTSIQVNNQQIWRNSTTANNLDKSWKNHEIDIPAADLSPAVQVKYMLQSGSSGQFGGWNIDDFALFGLPETFTPLPSYTPSLTPTASLTPTPTPSPTRSATPTASPTPRATNTRTPTLTPTVTVPASPSLTPTPTLTPTMSVTSTNTPTASSTPTYTPSPTTPASRPTPPILETEPPVTAGLANTISWLRRDLRATAFYAEYSDAPDFGLILGNSGWTSVTTHTFTGLEHEVTYYYRVKSRIVPGFDSDWSHVEYSTQQVKAPGILLAGYWDTDLVESAGGRLTFIALSTDAAPAIPMVVRYGGVSIGMELNDQAQNGDWSAGDGIFGTSILLSSVGKPVTFMLSLEADNGAGVTSAWPWLVVTP